MRDRKKIRRKRGGKYKERKKERKKEKRKKGRKQMAAEQRQLRCCCCMIWPSFYFVNVWHSFEEQLQRPAVAKANNSWLEQVHKYVVKTFQHRTQSKWYILARVSRSICSSKKMLLIVNKVKLRKYLFWPNLFSG